MVGEEEVPMENPIMRVLDRKNHEAGMKTRKQNSMVHRSQEYSTSLRSDLLVSRKAGLLDLGG